MKYKILLLLFFSFWGMRTAISQITVEGRAVVYGADGSVFIGQIVKEDILTIELIALTGDTLHISKNLIKRIRRTSKDIMLHRGAKFHYTSGVFVSTTVGAGLDGGVFLDWDLIVGKRLNRKVSIGLGASRNYNYADFRGVSLNSSFTPVFAYGRYYLTHKKARLFAATRIGYGFASNRDFWSEHTGGFHFQPGIGVHFSSRKYIRFIITLSQMLQNMRGGRRYIDLLSNPVDLKYNFWHNRTMLKVGIEFR